MLFKVGLLLSLLSIVVAKTIVEPKPKHAFSSQHVHKHDGHHELVTHKEHGHEKHHDYYAHPKYEFEYKIKDDHTGDHKNHHETRDGDVVKGFYEFKDPDGTVRRVEYHADKHSGFHANVKHSTHHQHKEHKM